MHKENFPMRFKIFSVENDINILNNDFELYMKSMKELQCKKSNYIEIEFSENYCKFIFTGRVRYNYSKRRDSRNSTEGNFFCI